MVEWDEDASLRLYSWLSSVPLVRKAFKVFSQLGSTPFWCVVMGALYIPGVVARFFFPPQFRSTALTLMHLGLAAFSAFVTIQVVVLPVKYSVKRQRPFQRHEGVTMGDFSLQIRTWSFPSGHCVMWVAVGGVLSLALNSGALMFLVISLLPVIAISRVALGVHYVLDVVAGVAFGFVCFGLAVLLLPYYFSFYYWVFSLVPI